MPENSKVTNAAAEWRSSQKVVLCKVRGPGKICPRTWDLKGMCGTNSSEAEKKFDLGIEKPSPEQDLIGCPIAGEFLLKKIHTQRGGAGGEVTLLQSTDGKQLQIRDNEEFITVNQGNIEVQKIVS